MICAMSGKARSQSAKVDVLIPYWGDFVLLKKAVDSVLAQTESDFRLLIVDDCYPSEEAKKYYTKHKDSRVAYHRHKKNLGLVKNYNYALGRTTADHCVIMGCDDVMLPNYLERALKVIGNADYYQPGVNIIDQNDRDYLPAADRIKKLLRPRREGVHSGESVATSLCHGNWLYFPSILWKTTTLKKYAFDQDHPNTQDLITALDIICDDGKIYVDNAVTFSYRRSATSFSSKAKSGTRFSEEKEMYKNFAARFRKMGWDRAARAARLHLTVRLHQILA
jgi:glycosyltransferase involved in cell wall biosynthesis